MLGVVAGEPSLGFTTEAEARFVSMHMTPIQCESLAQGTSMLLGRDHGLAGSSVLLLNGVGEGGMDRAQPDVEPARGILRRRAVTRLPLFAHHGQRHRGGESRRSLGREIGV